MTESQNTNKPSNDLLTVLSIAIVAYASANVLHEWLGHGGACALVGATSRAVSAIYFDCDASHVSAWSQRLVFAGGSVVNLVAGSILLGLLVSRQWSPTLRYFLWLSGFLNFLMPFGYLMFSGVGGIGDWASFIEGLPAKIAWRLGLALLGAVLYFVATPRIFLPLFLPFVGTDADAPRQTKILTLYAYLAGGITFVVAGFLNPESVQLVLISAAAASFGGTFLLTSIPDMAKKAKAPIPPERLVIGRSIVWMVLAALTLVFFVGILGPSIKLG